MRVADTLRDRIATLFGGQWSFTAGRVVPTDTSVTLGNDGVNISAAVLYADMADSTVMVNTRPAWFAAEMYKAFLACAANCVRAEGGEITAYDGDRIMAVYMGEMRCDRAVRTAQKIQWCALNVIQPLISAYYPESGFQLKHVCGIDVSELMVAKTGARNANDLVWVGRAANLAAKLAADDDAWQTYITDDVYREMTDRVRLAGGFGANLWDVTHWPAQGNMTVYRSHSHWDIDTRP